MPGSGTCSQDRGRRDSVTRERGQWGNQTMARSTNTASESDERSVSKTTTKKELIDRIADHTGLRRADVKQTVQAFLDHVIDELGRGNRLEFRDFGVFEIKDRAPRLAQNPKTLERVHVPAKRTVKFKVGRLMKQSLDGVADESEAAADRL